MDYDAATLKFEQALPFALLPVSTQLAALHTVRTRSQSLLYACSRCGSELTSNTRVKRSPRNTRPSRSISTNCYVCGGVTSFVIDRGNATYFPTRKKLDSRVVLPEPISQDPVSNLTERPTSTMQSTESRTAQIMHSSNKPKKKSGLQEMLRRNREEEKKRTKAEDKKPAGLTAFLSTL